MEHTLHKLFIFFINRLLTPISIKGSTLLLTNQQEWKHIFSYVFTLSSLSCAMITSFCLASSSWALRTASYITKKHKEWWNRNMGKLRSLSHKQLHTPKMFFLTKDGTQLCLYTYKTTEIPCSVIQWKTCCLSALGWPSLPHPQPESAAHNQPVPSAALPAPELQHQTPTGGENSL